MNSLPPRGFRSLAVAIVVAALVIGTAIEASSYFGTATTVTRTSTVTTTANYARPWQVVKNNVTVSGGMAFNIYCDFPVIPTCPLPFPNDGGGPYLYAELVNYQGDYYYVHNNTILTGAVFTTATATTGVTTTYVPSGTQITIWFTNSTIYCVSPEGFWSLGYPTCPQ